MKNIEILRLFIGREFENSPSPFMQWLKPIVVSAEEGSLEFQYTVRPEWLNPAGNLHGGMAAAILDDIIGATIFTLGDPNFYSTINNAIDYFATARLHDILIAQTQIIKRGRNIVNVECTIYNADKSKILARGTSNLLRMEWKHQPGRAESHL